MEHGSAKIKRQYVSAVLSSMCARILFVNGNIGEDLWLRIYVVAFAYVPWYYWVKYLNSYMDQKAQPWRSIRQNDKTVPRTTHLCFKKDRRQAHATPYHLYVLMVLKAA